MLPHVDTEDRRVAVHQRAVLIWGGDDFELAILVLDQPCPSTAETAYTRSTEFFFKLIEAPERGFDVVGKFAFRFAAGIRSDDLPKERVIGMAAAVIPNNCANVFRHGIEVTDKVLYGFLLEIGAVTALFRLST